MYANALHGVPGISKLVGVGTRTALCQLADATQLSCNLEFLGFKCMLMLSSASVMCITAGQLAAFLMLVFDPFQPFKDMGNSYSCTPFQLVLANAPPQLRWLSGFTTTYTIIPDFQQQHKVHFFCCRLPAFLSCGQRAA